MFATLPKDQHDYIMRAPYQVGKQSFREMFRRFQKNLKHFAIPAPDFDTLWGHSIDCISEDALEMLQTPFGKWLANTKAKIMKLAEAAGKSDKRLLEDLGGETAAQLFEANVLMQFEKHYRKVLIPSPGLIANLSTTEITPPFGDIQPPYPCVYIQFPGPIQLDDMTTRSVLRMNAHTRIFIPGIYLWKRHPPAALREILGSAIRHECEVNNKYYSLGKDTDVLSFTYPLVRPDLPDALDHIDMNHMDLGYQSCSGLSGEDIMEGTKRELENKPDSHALESTLWLFRLSMNLCLWLSNKEEQPVLQRDPRNVALEADPNQWRRKVIEAGAKTKPPIDEIILGQNIKIDEETARISKQMQSAEGRREVRTHWRRGHWRQQAIGPRSAMKHAWRWITRILVKKDKGNAPLSTTYELDGMPIVGADGAMGPTERV